MICVNGVANTDPVFAPGSSQPVGGFSALLDAGNGELWAMPDNGFGNKTNSRSFALRLYRVKPRWETKYDGPGTVQMREAVTLSDPDYKIPFRIVNENVARPEARILTGGDLDIESVRRAPDGTLWSGEEFGPFIVHTDAKGRVLDAPVPLPRVWSSDNPFLFGRTPNLGGSNGFEAMALSADGKTRYPILEGPVAGDDPLSRLGNPFKFPYVTVEAVLPVGGNDLAFVNDTNFGSTGRNPGLPDYSDFIIVKVPGLRLR